MQELIVNMQLVYYIYVRKSTDVEDKQILSVEAQIVELRKYAADNNMQIAGVIVEKQSAKKPGRKKFNAMMKDIEAGKANGILSWHPDRLARNSVDGGHIIYLLDQSRLVALKFPTFWFENTSQGKFMLSMAFSQSKYYVDNLSENTKRGLRQKVRRGEFPSKAPVGYINDVRTKSIAIDKRRAPYVVEAFEMYARGGSRLVDIADFLASKGIKTVGNKPLSKDQVKHMLKNPFYYGHFYYGGEVHEGKHKAIIDKKLFDRVQVVLAQRGYTPHKTKNEPRALCGLLACGVCNMSITAEKKVKHQKNGNIHEYVYYRCTRKSKTITCKESPITEPVLLAQLADILQGYALPKSWADPLMTMLEEDEKQAEQSSGVLIADARNKIGNLQGKLQRLLDGYLDQDIDRQTFLAKKSEILSEKKSLEESLANLQTNQFAWLEPMRNWLETAKSICNLRETDNFGGQKAVLSEIFGLNLFLSNKTLTQTPNGESLKTTFRKGAESGFCLWQELKNVQQKIAQKGEDLDFYSEMVSFYAHARTHFSTKSEK